MTILNEDGTTSRPWNRENYSEIYGGIHRTGIGNDQGTVIFNGLTPLTKEDADLIHVAVNAHDDLLAAAKQAVIAIETVDSSDGNEQEEALDHARKIVSMLRSVIKKAEEKSNG